MADTVFRWAPLHMPLRPLPCHAWFWLDQQVTWRHDVAICDDDAAHIVHNKACSVG